MKYLLKEWGALTRRIKAGRLLLFFDFDGTLSPIVSRPAQAGLPGSTKSLLRRIAGMSSCRVAIVSGRALEDIRKKVGLKGVVYVGNHGLQSAGPGVRHTVRLSAGYRKAIGLLRPMITEAVRKYRGVLIEDKGCTLSVHYRRVSAGQRRAVLNAVDKIVRSYGSGRLVRIRPAAGWDKGSAVRWLIERWGAMDKGVGSIPVYCGDDSTDEDAFRALAHKGITVVVGRRRSSAARYYLRSQDEVNELLKRIVAHRA
ncbi:MAG: trehalose-phosphatase [Candidatus Omnitrophota bacterium]